jgi:regulator of protease activity HflC (stomatin/prohibitin superfamily)
MGSKPGTDPTVQLKSCTQTWQVTQKEKTCELFYTSIRNLTPEQAVAKCATTTVKSQLKQLKSPSLATSAPAPHL